MTKRFFILIDENLSISKELNLLEALDELESASKEDHKFRTLNWYSQLQEELLNCESGTVFVLPYVNSCGIHLNKILTAIDLDHQPCSHTSME
jgi:hypothetical protein